MCVFVQLIAAETKNLFGGLNLGPDQGADLRTWSAQFKTIDELPKLTRKLLSIAVGITNNGLNAITRSNVPSSQCLVNQFVEASPTGLLSNQSLISMLVSAMSEAFLSAETYEELRSEVQVAVEDGRLRVRLDLSNRLMQWLITQGFARSPHNGKIRGLTLQDFIGSVDRFEQHLQEPARTFLSMIQGTSTRISAKQVEGMLKDVIMFTTQLNLNIIGFERPLLQQRGVTAGAMKSREIEMCRVQENIQTEVANAMGKLLHGNSGREFELQEWVTMFHQNMPLVCQQVETLLKGVLMMSGGSLPATSRYSYRSAARSRSPQQQSRSPSRKESSPSTRGFESGLEADLSNTAMIFEQVRSKAQSQPRDVSEEVREASRSPAGRSVQRDGSQERVAALLEKYSPPRSAPVVAVAEPVRAAPAASLRSWLAQHELTEWATALEREAVDLSTLTLLSDADLKDIGLPLGHRRRMLHAITQLEHDAAAVKPQVPLQQNNAEQIYRPMEAEPKPASQPRSVSRSRSPQNVYAPMPEPDNYQEIYNVAEAAEADRIQQEIQQVSEQFEPEPEASEVCCFQCGQLYGPPDDWNGAQGKMMEMADGTIRMVSSPSKERPRGSQSRSPPREASPEKLVHVPISIGAV